MKDKNLDEGTFIKIEKESKLNFKASSDLELFEIRSPLKPQLPYLLPDDSIKMA